MDEICKHCRKPIKISIFKGGDWCSEDCRKALLGKVKCSYKAQTVENLGYVEACVVHHMISKYPKTKGLHRPCLAVEPL